MTALLLLLWQPDFERDFRLAPVAAVKSAYTQPRVLAKRLPSVGRARQLPDVPDSSKPSIKTPEPWDDATGVRCVFDTWPNATIWVAERIEKCPPGASREGLTGEWAHCAWLSLGKVTEWRRGPLDAKHAWRFMFAAEREDGVWVQGEVTCRVGLEALVVLKGRR